MRTLIILPTYNERENIAALLTALLAHHPLRRALVIDDGSPDGTAACALSVASTLDGRVEVLSRAKKSGLGSAYRVGLDRASRRDDIDSAVIMDADWSHAPEDVHRLESRLGSADLVIGSRYVSGGRIEGWTLDRRLLSRFGSAYARTVLSRSISDWTSGFMMLRHSALNRLPFRSGVAEGYAATIELKWLGVRAGLRVVEEPITFRDRRAGSSKMNGGIMIEAAARVWSLRKLPESGAAEAEV